MQHRYDTAACTQTDPPWGSTRPGRGQSLMSTNVLVGVLVRWFKHITDAAATYKVKDDGRGNKQLVSAAAAHSSDRHLPAAGPALDTSSSSADVTSPVTPSFL